MAGGGARMIAPHVMQGSHPDQGVQQQGGQAHIYGRHHLAGHSKLSGPDSTDNDVSKYLDTDILESIM